LLAGSHLSTAQPKLRKELHAGAQRALFTHPIHAPLELWRWDLSSPVRAMRKVFVNPGFGQRRKLKEAA